MNMRMTMKIKQLVVWTRRCAVLALCALLLAACAKAPAPQTCAEPHTYADVLYARKTAYVGDNAAVSALLNSLEFPGNLNERRDGFALSTAQRPYALTVRFKLGAEELAQHENAYETEFSRNTLALFALIENLDLLNISIADGSKAIELQFSRGWADYMAGGSVSGQAVSLEGFTALLALQPYYLPEGAFILSRMERGVEILARPYPMTRAENAVCHAAVMELTLRSTVFPGTPPEELASCYRLCRYDTNVNEIAEYYMYEKDGTPVLQVGDAYYGVMNEQTYSAVAALAEDAGAAVAIIGGADGPTAIFVAE